MDFKWIKTFLSAAETQNFRKSAEKLYLSQPTVTVHIRSLEQQLGVRLFERAGRQVYLTEAGKRFYPHAAAILDRYEQGVQDIEDWRQGYTRQFTLGVSPQVASTILSPVLRRFVQAHPMIRVEIKVLESNEIANSVLNGDTDLGLSRMAVEAKELVCQKMYQDPVLFVTSHDGGDSETYPPPDWRWVVEEQLILTHNHPVYWGTVIEQLKRLELRFRTMVVSQVHITKKLVEDGLGVSFLPYSSVKRELIEGRLLSINIPDFSIPPAATYYLYKRLNRETYLFLTFLRSIYPTITLPDEQRIGKMDMT